MNMNIDSIIDQMKDEIIKSTQEMVMLKSVKGKYKEGMPFGEDIDKCYRFSMKLAEDLGLSIKDFDGYAGHVEIGNGEEVIGILGHLDVVPEADNWTYPPYNAEIHDGKIFGRGTIDDKGPMVAVLYAIKALQIAGVEFNKKIRVIFGLDEESDWESVEYYLKRVEEPNISFTPDGAFPVIYGEKGISEFSLYKDIKADTANAKGTHIIHIKGGYRSNMVPDYCEVLLETDENIGELFSKYKIQENKNIVLEKINNQYLIKSYGFSAHGSLPQKGINAITQLLLFLDELEIWNEDLRKVIEFYIAKIGDDFYGYGLGCESEDDISGKLTVNIGIINYDSNENEKKFELVVNIRYPIKSNSNEMYKNIRKTIETAGLKISITKDKAPLYIPPDSEIVTKLMKAYKYVTKDEVNKPITISGGTYARAVNNAVAFGPAFPGKPEVGHQKDEYILIDDLIMCTKIYAHAIYELLQ